MAVGEQAGQGLADEVALADDDPADLGLDRLRPLGEGFRGEALAGRGGVGAVEAFIRSSGSWVVVTAGGRASPVTGSGRAS